MQRVGPVSSMLEQWDLLAAAITIFLLVASWESLHLRRCPRRVHVSCAMVRRREAGDLACQLPRLTLAGPVWRIANVSQVPHSRRLLAASGFNVEAHRRLACAAPEATKLQSRVHVLGDQLQP